MPKSNQRQNKKKSQPDARELKPIKIDETIVSGKTSKMNGGENLSITVPLDDFLQQIDSFQIVEDDDDDEVEEIHEEVFEEKLEEVLGTTTFKVNQTNLKKYLKYLKKNLAIPCLVTGVEEFEWEEYYTVGPGSQKEYQKLKKTQPSYTDEFNILKLDNKLDVEHGILAVLERTTDNLKFTLPLAELEGVAEDSVDAKLLQYYGIWFFTY